MFTAATTNLTHRVAARFALTKTPLAVEVPSLSDSGSSGRFLVQGRDLDALIIGTRKTLLRSAQEPKYPPAEPVYVA